MKFPRSSVLRLTVFGAFYASPFFTFILSARLFSEEKFTNFNTIFLTAALISFSVDFGDELRIPKLEMAHNFGNGALKVILLNRVRRGAFISIAIVIAAFVFERYEFLVWCLYAFASALNLSFWHKAKGTMELFIIASLPFRLLVLALIPIYSETAFGIHLAALMFYFGPSVFLLIRERAWGFRKEEVPKSATLERLTSFILLGSNPFVAWAPFFLFDNGVIELSFVALFVIRLVGYLTQVFGMLAAVLHRKIWTTTNVGATAKIKNIRRISAVVGVVSLLLSADLLYASSSQISLLALYVTLRIFFFAIVFLFLVHLVSLTALSLSALVVNTGWVFVALFPATVNNVFFAICISYSIAFFLLVSATWNSK